MRDCFIKFSKDKKHLIDFIENGHIYINTIKYFSNCKDEDYGQSDKLEMITSYHQNKNASININGRKFKIVKPFSLREGEADYTHIFCFYTLSNESISHTDKDKIFSEQLWNEFGEYFIFIHDAHSFMKRLDKKLKELNIHYKADYVEYFCPHTYEGKVDIFQKRNIYSHQEEFRIAINKPNYIKPITDLYLGNLSDIAYGPIYKDDSKNSHNKDGLEL